MLANVTHFETPLDPAAGAQMVFEGRRQADNIIRFLRAEFPRIFADAKVRTYGNPGLHRLDGSSARSSSRSNRSDRVSGLRMPRRAARGGWSCTMPESLCTGSASRPTTCTTSRSRAWFRARPTTSSPPAAASTPTSAHCRRSGSWARASQWVRRQRMRSIWRERSPFTRSICPSCRSALLITSIDGNRRPHGIGDVAGLVRLVVHLVLGVL